MSIYLHDIPLSTAQDHLKQSLEAAGLWKVLGSETIKLDENALGLTAVEFTFAPDSCQVRFFEGPKEHVIDCGFGQWKSGQTALPGWPPRLVSGGAAKPGTLHSIAAAGAWQDAHTLRLQIRFVETPHHDILTCQFREGSVEIAFLSSMAAMSTKPSDPRKPLTGKLHS